jgi:predicted small secreted protein
MIARSVKSCLSPSVFLLLLWTTDLNPFRLPREGFFLPFSCGTGLRRRGHNVHNTQAHTSRAEEKAMKRRLLTASLLALAAHLSACNTISGMGKDIQKAGEKIEEVGKKK